MSFELPYRTIRAALEQLRGVQLWPLQSLDKEDNGAFWFTLGVPAEGFRRLLTLRFDRSLEVHLPDNVYIVACMSQIVEAVRIFWGGTTSAPRGIVSLSAF